MSIKPSPEVIGAEIPTKTDSLQKAVEAMQVKIDSLQKIVTKTEIGTEFFSDVNANLQTSFASYTALQLAFVSILVTVAGVVSWKWLTVKLNKVRNESRSYTDTGLHNIKKDLDDNFLVLSDEIVSTAYDVQRSMFFHNKNNENKSSAFQWALSAFCTLMIYNPEDKWMLHYWARTSMDMLSMLNVGDLDVVKENKKLMDYNKLIENLEDPELIEIFKDYKEDLYHILYAKQQPPENLMEDSIEVAEEK